MMHSLKVFWFECERCGATSEEYQESSAALARHDAHRDGWSILTSNAARCPECVAGTPS